MEVAGANTEEPATETAEAETAVVMPPVSTMITLVEPSLQPAISDVEVALIADSPHPDL